MTITYQIGRCHYQPETGKLIHPDKSAPWQLPRVEKQLLDRLLSQRGQILSKRELRLDQQQLSFSDSAVVKGVFTLRHYIDDEQHLILQTVAGEGYRLAGESNDEPIQDSWLQIHFVKLCATLCSITLALVVLFGLMSTSLAQRDNTAFQQTNQLIGNTANPLTVNAISKSKVNQKALSRYQQQLQQSIEACPSQNWDRAYIALSHDDMILNITLLADRTNHTQLRNIKISDFRLHGNFLSEQWLKEAKLCG